MAKPKYAAWIAPDGLTAIRAWAREGLVDEAIAQKMGISPSTLYAWQKDHPEIRKALAEGKAPVDAEVEDRLLDMCRGFMVQETKIFKVKTEHYDEAGRKVTEEKLEERQESRYIQPSVDAQKFWLSHRKPVEWGEKPGALTDGGMQDAEIIITGQGDVE